MRQDRAHIYHYRITGPEAELDTRSGRYWRASPPIHFSPDFKE